MQNLNILSILLVFMVSIISGCSNLPNQDYTQEEIGTIQRYENILKKYNVRKEDYNVDPQQVIKMLNTEERWSGFENSVRDFSFNDERDAYNEQAMKLTPSVKTMDFTEEERQLFYESLNYRNGKSLQDLYDFVIKNKTYFNEDAISELAKVIAK